MIQQLKPCPFCGEKIDPPKSRPSSAYRIEGFVAFAACYCGGHSATAYKMGKGSTEAEAIQEVVALWNRRAQPAEAEGVDFGFDDRSVKVSQEAYRIFLEREQHHLAALSAVTAERDRLREDRDSQQRVCIAEMEKVNQLRAEAEALRKDAARYRFIRSDSGWEWDDSCYNIEISIEAELCDECTNLDEAIDAAMAAKEA